MENSNDTNNNFLNQAEIGSIIAAGIGTIIGGIYQPVILTCLPISLALALNVRNRQLLLANLTATHKYQLEQLEAKAAQKTNLQQQNVSELSNRMKLAEDKLVDLEKTSKTLESSFENLQRGDQELQGVVSQLRSIENISQAISANPTAANFYLQRAQSRENLGDQQGAISDYSLAIHYDPNLALAYYHRALLSANLNNRKGSLEDLRKAAKLFFETGDLTNYQKVKELSRDIHDLNAANTKQESDNMLIGNLFS